MVQVLVGCRIVPAYIVGLALTNLSTMEVVIVQIVRSGTSKHATEHHLIVILTLSEEGVVVVFTHCYVLDFDTNGPGLVSDQFCSRVPVRVRVNTSQSEGQALTFLLVDAI